MPVAVGLLLAVVAGVVRAAPLDYVDAPFAAEVSEATPADPGARVEYLVKFPSPLASRFPANDTVWGHLRLPAGAGPFPTVLVLPVMAAPNVWIEERFMRRLTREGFAVMWIEMPFQFNRRPHASMPSGQVFLARTAPVLARNFRQSALDARRALAWLKRHPAVDPERIGLFGVSLGAMVGAAVMSVDPAPRRAVFLLGGADFPGLVAASAMTAPFIRKAGIDPAELRRAWAGLDPLDYRERNAGKNVVLINASWDRVIPKANALKLRDAFPGAPQRWVPLGHYGAILHLVWIPRFVARLFREGLSPSSPRPSGAPSRR